MSESHDGINVLLDSVFRALVANAKRDGFRMPFEVLVIDAAGARIGPDHAPGTEVTLPIRFVLNDVDGRRAELVVESLPEPRRVLQ